MLRAGYWRAKCERWRLINHEFKLQSVPVSWKGRMMAPVYIHITEDSTLNPTVDAISIVDANLQQRPVSPRAKFPYYKLELIGWRVRLMRDLYLK